MNNSSCVKLYISKCRRTSSDWTSSDWLEVKKKLKKTTFYACLTSMLVKSNWHLIPAQFCGRNYSFMAC